MTHSKPHSAEIPASAGSEYRFAGALSAVVALRMLGLFLVLPVFMLLATGVSGYSPQTAGLAVGIYGLTQALLQQPFGWLSDRLGRKPVMFMGLVLFAAGGVVAALAESMTGIIAGRALQGCGAIAGVAMAFAADRVSPQRRSLAMAIIGMGIGGAFLMSMALSVPLANLLGLSGLFWLTAGLAVLGMVILANLKEGIAVVDPAAEEEMPEEGENSTSAAVWLLSVAVFLLHAAMTLLFIALPPRLATELGIPLAAHWKIYVPSLLLSVIIMMPLLHRAGRQLSEHRLLPGAFGVLGLSLIGLSWASGHWWVACGLVVYFVGFNLLEAAMPSVLSRLAGTRSRGRRMGLYTTFQFLGAFAGGVAGGALLSALGSQYALAVAAVACLLFTGVFSVVSGAVFPKGNST